MGAMLLFGLDRERHFPDAWIQAGWFRGTDKSRIDDRAEIRSLPVWAIEEAIAFVQKHALQGAEIGAVHRGERWNLLPVALREEVINAVAHVDRKAPRLYRWVPAGRHPTRHARRARSRTIPNELRKTPQIGHTTSE